MKIRLPLFISLFAFLFCSSASLVSAQEKSVAFAVTSDSIIGLNWNVFRPISLANGSPGDVLSRAPVTSKVINTTGISKVAACAYDRTTNKLFFVVIPMNDLYSVAADGRSAPVKLGTLQTPPPSSPASEENNITRMAIGVDGKGYALSNDGHHLFSFTTGKHTNITSLGSLKDDAANGKVSVHTALVSWGGDMVADAHGYLYLIDMYNKVFKIDVSRMQATLQGTIQGLPQGFYTNGAAVNDDDKLLLSSVTYAQGYYLLDMSTLKAEPLAGNGNVYGASDLTSSGLLYENRSKGIAAVTPVQTLETNPGISIWPNPATGGQFNLAFKNIPKGAYTIQLVDLKGQLRGSKSVKIEGEVQNTNFQYDGNVLTGVYLVKIIGLNGKVHSTHKIVVAAQ